MKKNKTPYYRPSLTEHELLVLLRGLDVVVEDLRKMEERGKYVNGVLSLRRRFKSGMKRVQGLDCPLLWERKREVIYVKGT